ILVFLCACVSCQIADRRTTSDVHVKQDGRHQPEYYGYAQQCPDAEDFAPCVCTYDSFYLTMYLTCSRVESEEQLKQIFKADFPFKNFTLFILKTTTILKYWRQVFSMVLVLKEYIFPLLIWNLLNCKL
ncbi:unnamed protein product, partial [Meganyctiphanes norvegica]